MSVQEQVVSSNTQSTDSPTNTTVSTTTPSNTAPKQTSQRITRFMEPMDIFHTHFDPWYTSPFGSLFGSQFRSYFESPFGSYHNTPYSGSMFHAMTNSMSSLRDDISELSSTGFVEKDGEYVCALNIPEDMIKFVKVSERDGRIMISAERVVEHDDSEEGLTKKNHSTSSFQQILRLPRDAVRDSATAKYSSSKLEIHVKRETGRSVEVEHMNQ